MFGVNWLYKNQVASMWPVSIKFNLLHCNYMLLNCMQPLKVIHFLKVNILAI